MGALLTIVLRTVLSALADNKVYNATFELSSTVEGEGVPG